MMRTDEFQYHCQSGSNVGQRPRDVSVEWLELDVLHDLPSHVLEKFSVTNDKWLHSSFRQPPDRSTYQLKFETETKTKFPLRTFPEEFIQPNFQGHDPNDAVHLMLLLFSTRSVEK